MKKIYITISFIIFSSVLCNAQWVTIPDTAFVRYLQITFPSCMNGNQMDTTCSGIVNATHVFCSDGNISDLTGIQYFKNLDTLNCRNNLLTTLPPLSNLLTFLDCSSNGLTSLPTFSNSLAHLDCSNNKLTGLLTIPDSLTYLDCSLNALTVLSTLPGSLSFLDCEEDELTDLPTLPASLVELDCGFNQSLTEIPVLPASLAILYCDYDWLEGLPPLPNTLTYLTCDANLFDSLPTLPSSLTYLECGQNLLTSLPTLPDSLTFLDCWFNRLTNLPTLPNSLITLYCYNNQLTVLPALPNSLNVLACDANQLTILPTLSDSLLILDCSNNQLTGLPVLPNSITQLDCENNQITSLINLPSVMYGLSVSNNPLNCLPPFKKIISDSFNISNTGITCLPNVVENPSNISLLNTMPVCDVFNPHGCEVAWNIKGQVVKDADGSCATTMDGTEVRNISMKLYSGGALQQQVYTNGGGDYSFDTQLGIYTVEADTVGLPFTVLCPSGINHTDTLTAADSLDYSANFRLYCKPGYDLGVNAVASYNTFFPGHIIPVSVFAGDEASYYGVPCNTGGLNGTITAVITGPVTIMSATSSSNAVSSISGDTVTWVINDFSQLNFTGALSLQLRINYSAVAGQQVCIDVTINGNGTDNNPSNNNISQCYTVVNSYDPNDKEVYPSGNLIPGYDGYLTYTIHFQNTGTAPAENIQVIDTLDRNLDISTFQLIAASSENLTQVLVNQRIVEFNFPNINLVDSTHNEPASHGYVQYKIKPVSGQQSSISNTAYIYFDFNSPVVTNTTVSSFATGINTIAIDKDVKVYPNPVSEQLIVSSKQLSMSNIEIDNVLGRSVLMQYPTGDKFIIDVSQLTSGLYFIHIHSTSGETVKKFVVER